MSSVVHRRGMRFALTGWLVAVGACVLDETTSAIPPAPDADLTPPIDATPACEDQQNALNSGHHPVRYDQGTGAGCLGQCHQGTLGPKFTVGGTLFDRRTAGGDPIAGAKIYVIDNAGKVVEMITATNGNFWTDEPLSPPIRTYATACPDSIPMIDVTTGNCNQGNCHGENEKIYLPGPAGL